MSTPDVSGRLTLSVEEAAQILGVSRATGYQAVKDGRIPSLQLGTQRRVIPTHRFLTEVLGLPIDTAAQMIGVPGPGSSEAAPDAGAATATLHTLPGEREHTHHAATHTA